MTRSLWACWFAVLVGIVIVGAAQAPTVPIAPKPPELTEVQRLQLQVQMQRIEIAQLRAQAAQRDFDEARNELQKLATSLQVAGYDLDLQRLVYVKQPSSVKK